MARIQRDQFARSFHSWARYAGPETWPRPTARTPIDRYIQRWASVSYLYARDQMSRLDPVEYPIRDHVRVRIEVLSKVPRGTKAKRLAFRRSMETIGNFDHYLQGDTLEEDVTLLNVELFGFLQGRRLPPPDPSLKLQLRFYSPTAAGRQGKGKLRREWLATHIETWL